jgi:hypothetical protein
VRVKAPFADHWVGRVKGWLPLASRIIPGAGAKLFWGPSLAPAKAATPGAGRCKPIGVVEPAPKLR